MAVPTYHWQQANGLTRLKAANGQVMGGVTTSSTGNTIRQTIGTIEKKGAAFGPPGGDWSAERTTGRTRRVVIWQWRIVCNSLADLLTIERYIDEYLEDGREYTLDTGETASGRANDYVVLQRQGTGPVGPLETMPDGRYGRRWRLTFHVLWPKIEANWL